MDIFKIFRSCFYCKHRQNEPLLFVVHPGYYTTYHYFHRSCLQKVLNEPENNVEFLDTAVQISDQEEINRRHEAAKIEKHISQILRANEIVQRQRTSANEERQRQRVEIKNQIESIQEVKKTLAKIDLDINKEKEVKKHDNKFKNFFGD